MAQEQSGSGKQDDRKAAGAVLKGATGSAAAGREDERRRRAAGGWLWRNGGTNFIGLLLLAGLALVTTLAVGDRKSTRLNSSHG